VNTFVKIFSDSGSGGERRLENEINEMAQKRNLDIVSANPCFRKGFLDADMMIVVVVFRKKGATDERN
jgi:hypothetical protein